MLKRTRVPFVCRLFYITPFSAIQNSMCPPGLPGLDKYVLSMAQDRLITKQSFMEVFFIKYRKMLLFGSVFMLLYFFNST